MRDDRIRIRYFAMGVLAATAGYLVAQLIARAAG
jgi:hypothetical protein